VRITWDEPKRIANIQKHRMDFASLSEDFFLSAYVRRAKSGRFQAIGENAKGVISVVFARYGMEGISIISMRPARKDERELYRGKE
jgi:uncharacterized DUF497 family protein